MLVRSARRRGMKDIVTPMNACGIVRVGIGNDESGEGMREGVMLEV